MPRINTEYYYCLDKWSVSAGPVAVRSMKRVGCVRFFLAFSWKGRIRSECRKRVHEIMKFTIVFFSISLKRFGSLSALECLRSWGTPPPNANAV